MANERPNDQFTDAKEPSTLQIPTAVMVGDEFLDDEQELAVLLAKIHDLANGEQLRNRFKYFLRGLLLLFVSFLIPPLIFLEFIPEIIILALAGGVSFWAILLIFKGFSVAWRPLSLRKVYLTKYLVPYDSTENNHSTLVFDANSLHGDTNLRYSEITPDQIQEVIGIQSTIADQDRNFDSERQVAQTISEINRIVVSPVPTDIRSQVVKNDSVAIKGIQSVIAMSREGRPYFQSRTLRFTPDNARTQTIAIHDLENKRESLSALSDIREEIKRVSDEFIGPLDNQISEIEQYEAFVKKSQSDRWFQGEAVEEHTPEFDYGEFGLTIGRYKTFHTTSDENPLKLLNIPNKIIRRLQDLNKKDVDDLIESQKRELLGRKEESNREITKAREGADRKIQQLRSNVERAKLEYSYAEQERESALATYNEYSGKKAEYATERTSFQATARQAHKIISDRDKTMGELHARILKDEEDANEEEIRTQVSITEIRESVERQVSNSRTSVGTQVRSKMANIEKVVKVRDMQLDLAFTFLNRSLTDEFESHSRPFVLRRKQLFDPSTNTQNQIDSRIEDLIQVLGQINDLKTDIVVDTLTEIHIPFWIAELAKDSEKHIRVFTLGEIENRSESSGSWLKEKLGATQYLDSLKPVSNDLTSVALALQVGKSNADLLSNSIQIPLGQEESGLLTDKLSGLAEQGLISEQYANRVTKYWTSKSVGPNEKFDSRKFTETVFVHDQEQQGGISDSGGDAVESSALPSQPDIEEINLLMDYELKINGDVVDRPEDVDTLMSLLTNVDDTWEISDKESDNHFIQASTTSGTDESIRNKHGWKKHYALLSHWNDGTQICEIEDVDVSVANKIVKAFLEKDYDSINETADSLLEVEDDTRSDDIPTQGKLLPGSNGLEIDVAISYELNLDGDIVDRPKDVDALLFLLINVDEFWIISENGSDNHFIQGLGGGAHGLSYIEHQNGGDLLSDETDLDVSVAHKIVKAFLEGQGLVEIERLMGSGEDTFCTSCASKLTPEQAFCPSCGEKRN
jgi:hypothetical protein